MEVSQTEDAMDSKPIMPAPGGKPHSPARLVPLLAFLIAVLLCSPARGETVVLKNGLRITGKIIQETTDKVVIEAEWGKSEILRSHIQEILRGDSEGPCKCPVCRGTRKIACGSCNGTKESPGCCPTCKGYGIIKCPHCKGDGKRMCTACNGHGQIKKFRRGGGWDLVPCRKCKGHGFFLCSTCIKDADGKPTGLAVCKRCKKLGRGPCVVCAKKGKVKCPFCNGSGEKEDRRTFSRITYLEIREKFFDPSVTEIQKKAYWEGLLGKCVFWRATVLNAVETAGGYILSLNLLAWEITKGEEANNRIHSVEHLAAFIPMREAEQVKKLGKGIVIWIAGEIAPVLSGPYPRIKMINTGLYPDER